MHDGKIVAACEEERFVRVKHGVSFLSDKTMASNRIISGVDSIQLRHFPVCSIDFCLKKAGIKLGDLDFISLGFDIGAILRNPVRYKQACGHLPFDVVRHRIAAFDDYVLYLKKLAKRSGAKLRFVRHHIAHAYGALFGSDFRRAIVLTVDGMGEFESSLLGCYHDGSFELLSRVDLPHSMGRVYSSITDFLGFQANCDEEKVMALAAYGRDTFGDQFSELVNSSPKGFQIKDRVFWNRDAGMGYMNDSELPSYFGPRGIYSRSLPAARFRNIAKSLQDILFRVTNSMVNFAIEQTGYNELCISGGVALNCENNGRIVVANRFTKVYVQPQASDAGVSVGAAYYVYLKETGKRGESMKHTYYGPSFSSREISSFLKQTKLAYRQSSDVGSEIAEHLAKGRVVGWFQGSAEIGPRALGNRSIIAAAGLGGIARKVNLIKKRESWRPFAATILDDRARAYLKPYVYAPFMNISFPLSPLGRQHLVSAQHVNGTTRPQTLKEEINTRFYSLIRRLHRKTGIPAVLNTSFNVAGEPIVNTPREAIVDFVTTSMDVLALGDFILEKREAL